MLWINVSFVLDQIGLFPASLADRSGFKKLRVLRDHRVFLNQLHPAHAPIYRNHLTCNPASLIGEKEGSEPS
jgi:hypothetical protein